MTPKRLIERRVVLKGIVAGTAFTTIPVGSVVADEHLISVSPISVSVGPEETVDVTVEIEGPPFGRTDIEVSGAPAEPANFRLSDRGDSEVVELGPVEEDTTAIFSAELPRGDEQEVDVEITLETDPLLDDTDADTEVPVVEFGADPTKEQFDALEDIELADPFTLAVEASELAGEASTDYAVTAFYEEFGESPNDRLAGPSVALEFDDRGIASVTIGSAGTDADVSTGLAPGPLSGDASLVNQIEVPEGSERMAVETQ